VELRFDANQGYSVEAAIYFAREARAAALAFLEQPTPAGRPELLGEVDRWADISIMADECVLSSRDVLRLARDGLADLVNLKLMKTGGIEEARRASAIAGAAGMRVMVGCMDESILGIAAGLHFACSTREVVLADLDGHLGLQGDPASLGFELHGGALHPLGRPGFGAEVREP
jgi:L-alanine-DL-glutamate epimerase-like enolase superfamily enzyme